VLPNIITDNILNLVVAETRYKVAMKAPKNIALRYFRFAANTGLTAEYLKLIGKRNDDKCWWCREAPTQNREHLFKKCRKWRRQQEKLWKRLGQVGLTKTHALSTIFAEPQATSSILDFLESTSVGKVGEEEAEKAGEREGERNGD